MNFRNIAIKTRLSLLVWLTLAIIAIGSIAGLGGLLRMGALFDQSATAHKIEMGADELALTNAVLENLVAREYLVIKDPAALAQIAKEQKNMEGLIAEAESLADTTESKNLVKKIKVAYGDHDASIKTATAGPAPAIHEELVTTEKELKATNGTLVAAINDLRAFGTDGVDAAEKAALSTRSLGMVIVAVMMLLTLGTALIFGLYIASSINKPLAALGAQATMISDGDMTVYIEKTGNDEIGHLEGVLGEMTKRLKKMIKDESETRDRLESQVSELSTLAEQAAQGDLTVTAPDYEGELGVLSKSFNQMTSGLRRLAEKMAEVINHLSSASSEIEVTAQQQASGSNEQAASVSEVTAAINELATNAKEVARAAESVSEAANEALDGAQSGAESVDDAASGMEEVKEVTFGNAQKIMALEERSQEIGSILAIIDDIAEQTNLLALNAAIEAARAGEAGKGFAVVAQEIRNLAEDVTSSTKEIAEKIKEIQTAVNSSVMATEESQKRTEEEVKVIREAGDGLKRIGQLTERTAELAMQISGAVQQQRTASEQVVQTMSEVSEVARQSALGSQESVKSAQDLATMAGDLKDMISVFKLD
ncbi:MAG: methyl-accepting chemotaxis protein [Actinomycetota bacterium]